MCSQRKTACDAGLKLGAAQEVHSFAASVLGDPPILVCSGAFVIVPHGEYEVVCIFVQLSFPRELGRYDFFFSSVLSLMNFIVSHMMSGWDLKMWRTSWVGFFLPFQFLELSPSSK